MASDLRHEQFMRLFLEHEPELFRSVLTYVPTRNDARDIVQEIAIALWNQFHQYDGSNGFVEWAAPILRMQVRRYLREAQRHSSISEHAAEILLAAESRFNDRFEEHRSLLQGCLDRLPSEQKGLIQGYYLEGRSVTHLAFEYSKSIDAVYKSIQRIRKALLACMERKLAEPH